RIPIALTLEIRGERAQRNEVQRKLRVWIAQYAADFAAQFRGSTGVGATEETAAIVVVGVEIVPDQRPAVQAALELADVRDRNLARDDFRSGPEHVNLRREVAP